MRVAIMSWSLSFIYSYGFLQEKVISFDLYIWSHHTTIKSYSLSSLKFLLFDWKIVTFEKKSVNASRYESKGSELLPKQAREEIRQR